MLNNSVFVYGSLLPCLHNHNYLLDGKLRRDNATLENYALYDTGSGYPCILPKEGGKVLGQVWDVDDETLESLDVLEGVPFLYTRNLCPVLKDEGRDCWTYVWARSSCGTMPIIKHGSWMDHVMRLERAA